MDFSTVSAPESQDMDYRVGKASNSISGLVILLTPTGLFLRLFPFMTFKRAVQ